MIASCGRSCQFQVWTSMEELLVSFDDKPFVSESYRGTLDGAGGRAERMAAADLPAELSQWMETLAQDSGRGVEALARIGTPAARTALANATKSGTGCSELLRPVDRKSR
jgi:hypothetical protein